MSTFPLPNDVVVGLPPLATVMLPVAANVPATGSYSSALARIVLPASSPQAMSTFPLSNRVAVWRSLASIMLPVGAKTPRSPVVVPVVPAFPVVPALPVVPAVLAVPPVALPPVATPPPVPPVPGCPPASAAAGTTTGASAPSAPLPPATSPAPPVPAEASLPSAAVAASGGLVAGASSGPLAAPSAAPPASTVGPEHTHAARVPAEVHVRAPFCPLGHEQATLRPGTQVSAGLLPLQPPASVTEIHESTTHNLATM